MQANPSYPPFHSPRDLGSYMERLNLPTVAQDGFDYVNTAILFRRTQQGFEISVTPWGSDQANAWANASVRRGTAFRTGLAANARMCGLF